MMSIDDDFYDVYEHCEGTDVEAAFDRLASHVESLEHENDNLTKRVEKIKIFKEVLKELSMTEYPKHCPVCDDGELLETCICTVCDSKDKYCMYTESEMNGLLQEQRDKSANLLWRELMVYCTRHSIHPSTQNDLFKICQKIRKRD